MHQNYAPEAFEYARKHRDYILEAARILGVDPVAVAGSIGEEINDVYSSTDVIDQLKHALSDTVPGIGASLPVIGTPASSLAYNLVPGVKSIGPGQANVHIETAVQLLPYYFRSTEGDPLNLARFYNGAELDLGKLIAALSFEPEVGIAFAALKLSQGEDWLRYHFGEAYDSQNPDIQDALLVEFYNRDPLVMSNEYHAPGAVYPPVGLFPDSREFLRVAEQYKQIFAEGGATGQSAPQPAPQPGAAAPASPPEPAMSVPETAIKLQPSAPSTGVVGWHGLSTDVPRDPTVQTPLNVAFAMRDRRNPSLSQQLMLQQYQSSAGNAGGGSMPSSVLAQSGQTFEDIANEYGLSVEQLQARNQHIRSPENLHTGVTVNLR